MEKEAIRRESTEKRMSSLREGRDLQQCNKKTVNSNPKPTFNAPQETDEAKHHSSFARLQHSRMGDAILPWLQLNRGDYGLP